MATLLLAQARWVAFGESDDATAAEPSKAASPMTSRIERYAVNNGTPTYFVRSACGDLERTMSLKYEEFRALHRRLSEEGGVLYATAAHFPHALRKVRLGMRLSPAEISEQCDGLNQWLKLTIASVGELPLALQKEVRSLVGLESSLPAWSTARGLGGLFAGALAAGRGRPKPREVVHPLGDSAGLLPGVTRRGRLECRDGVTGAWVSTHVILTHLSLLVFQPLDEASKAAGPRPAGARDEARDATASARAPQTAALSLAASVGTPGAHPSAAAINLGVHGDRAAGGGPAVANTSAGRLLHNLHVTDVLSILRHGDSNEAFAPPIHHRCACKGDPLNDAPKNIVFVFECGVGPCLRQLDPDLRPRLGFTIVDLNDTSISLRAVSARDCLQWLKCIARAKDRALAAVHRLDDKAHGHELVLATLRNLPPTVSDVPGGAKAPRPDSDEIIVARASQVEYGWSEPMRVSLTPSKAALFLELNAGTVTLDVAALLERAAADAAAGLGAARSAADADAAVQGGARGVLWAAVEPLDDSENDRNERLEVLIALDASRALEAVAQCGWHLSPVYRAAAEAVRVVRSSSALFCATAAAAAAVLPAVARPVLAPVFGSWRLVLSLELARRRAAPPERARLAEVDVVLWLIPLLLAWAFQSRLARLLASARERLAELCGSDTRVRAMTPEGEWAQDAVQSALRLSRRQRVDLDVRLVAWRWSTPEADAARRGMPPQPRPKRVELEMASTSAPGGSDDDARSHAAADEHEMATQKLAELPATVPKRFLGAVRGDLAQAEKRWAETVAWRAEGQAPEAVQQRLQPFFHEVKARHRHFLHKHDRKGHVVSYEVINAPNKVFKELGSLGVSVEDVAQHMHFVSAFTYATLLDDVDELGKAPRDPGGYFLKIIDLQAIGLGDMGGETAKYFRLVSAINRHYPERVWRTIIINAPSVFGVIWSIVSPLLEPNVREKITVVRSNYRDVLRDLVDPANLPVEYGGDDEGPSPQEERMAAFVDELNDGVEAPEDFSERDASEPTPSVSTPSSPQGKGERPITPPPPPGDAVDISSVWPPGDLSAPDEPAAPLANEAR